MKIESSHTPEEQAQQLAELVQTLREKGRMDLSCVQSECRCWKNFALKLPVRD